jgi:hypothetical protein
MTNGVKLVMCFKPDRGSLKLISLDVLGVILFPNQKIKNKLQLMLLTCIVTTNHFRHISYFHMHLLKLNVMLFKINFLNIVHSPKDITLHKN